MSWPLVILLRQNCHRPDSFEKFLDHGRRQRTGRPLLQTGVILETTEEVAEILVEAILDKTDVLLPVTLIQRFKGSPKNCFIVYLQKLKKLFVKKPVEHRVKVTDHFCGDIEEVGDKHSEAGVCRAELYDPGGHLRDLGLDVGVLEELLRRLSDALHADHGVSLALDPGEVQAGAAQGEEHPQPLAGPALSHRGPVLGQRLVRLSLMPGDAVLFP